MLTSIFLAGVPKPTVDAGNMPGAGLVGQLLSALMFIGFAMCVAGIILSAGMWAIGSFSNNYTQSVNGKKGFLISVASALFIGAAWYLVDWAVKLGDSAGNG